MPELITIEQLVDYVDHSELAQVAGIGSHNSEGGRSLDVAKINAAITFASDMVKGFMSKRFPIVSDLPPEQTPDLIKGYVADIVRYRLRSRSGNRNTTSDEVERRFKDARDWLKDVSRGLVNVDLSDAIGGDVASQAGEVNPAGTIRVRHPEARAPGILAGYLS